MAMIAVVVLAFGSIGGLATYFLVVKSDGRESADAEEAALPSGEAAAPTTGVDAGSTEPDAEAALSETPEPDQGLLPEASSQDDMEADITNLLTDFHNAVVERRFQDAWALLSARKQSQVEREDGIAAWRRAQASLTQYLDPSGLAANIEQLDRQDGTARVSVTGMGWSKPGAGCSEWSGLTWAKHEDGEWRYDPGYSTTSKRERAWKSRFSQLLGASC